MLTLNAVTFRFGDRLLFENLTTTIDRGDRIGIVGPNGTGKSTLMRIIAGDLQPTSGSRTIASGITIGYLPQGTLDLEHGTLAQALDPASGGYFSTQAWLDDATAALSGPDGDSEAVIAAWESAQAAFDAIGGYDLVDRLEAYLDRFSLPPDAMQRQLSQLSGGERTRAALATMLAVRPDILLLDEPTNHLDLGGQRWLIEFMQSYPGAIAMVSHDRALLNETITSVIALDRESPDVEQFTGTWANWIEVQQKRQAAAFETWKHQQQRIAGLQASIDQGERTARKVENETIHFHYRKRAAKVARAATVRRARLERMLESEEMVDKPQQQWGLAVEFPEPEIRTRDVVQLDQVTVQHENHTILDCVSLDLRYGERIAFIGPNGAGKTTLLRVISGDLPLACGSRRLGPGVRVGVLAQDQETLEPTRTVLESVQCVVPASESHLRTELHKYLFGGDAVHRRIADLSFGERTRLMLAMIAIPGADLLLLDEPHNHLDIDAREAFEEALVAFPGTVVLVSHDRFAVTRMATRILRVDDGALTDVDPATDPDFASLQKDGAPA